MSYQKMNQRETVGTVLCALLSIGTFGTSLFLWIGGLLPAFLALVISLACPIVWIVVLLWQDGDGGGLARWVRQRLVLGRDYGRRTPSEASAPIGSSARPERVSIDPATYSSNCPRLRITAASGLAIESAVHVGSVVLGG